MDRVLLPALVLGALLMPFSAEEALGRPPTVLRCCAVSSTQARAAAVWAFPHVQRVGEILADPERFDL